MTAMTLTQVLLQILEAGSPTRLPRRASGLIDSELNKKHRLITRAADTKLYSCPACRKAHRVTPTKNGGEYLCRDGAGILPADVTRRWRVQWNAVSQFVALGLECSGPLRILLSNRLSLLGRMGTQHANFPVWLACGWAHPDPRAAILNMLASRPPRLAGVVLTSQKLDDQLTLPNGSRALWLGDIMDLENHQQPLDVDAVWSSGPDGKVKLPGSRGRPKKPGDPLAAFHARVAKGNAKRAVGEEADAISKAEEKRFGKDKANGKKHVESAIRVHFRQWKQANFPRDFRWPE